MGSAPRHEHGVRAALCWRPGGWAAVRLSGTITLLLVGAGPVTLSAQQTATDATDAPALVFEGVTVVDVERGKLLPAQRVVIVGNHIQAVGSGHKRTLPRNAQVVDARGKYLIPGLWDLHVHPNRRAPAFYQLFIATGVTGIRDAWSPVPLDTQRQWRREILTGQRIGPPRQLLSGPALLMSDYAGFNSHMQDPVGQMLLSRGDTAGARWLVDSLKAAGADIIKTRGLSKELYAVVAAEARRVGIPFGGHTDYQPGGEAREDRSGYISALDASASGMRLIDHASVDNSTDLLRRCFQLDSASVERCRPVAEQFRRNNTWSVPTTTVRLWMGQLPAEHSLLQSAAKFWPDSALALDSVFILDRDWLRGFASVVDSLRRISRWPISMRVAAQVRLPILAGTDLPIREWGGVPNGFALHAELALLKDLGLTPLAALQAATLNPAKMWRATDSLGTVAAGKLADLVLLDANPLEDITNTITIRAVVANGRYFDRAALDRLLMEARATLVRPRPAQTP